MHEMSNLMQFSFVEANQVIHALILAHFEKTPEGERIRERILQTTRNKHIAKNGMLLRIYAKIENQRYALSSRRGLHRRDNKFERH